MSTSDGEPDSSGSPRLAPNASQQQAHQSWSDDGPAILASAHPDAVTDFLQLAQDREAAFLHARWKGVEALAAMAADPVQAVRSGCWCEAGYTHCSVCWLGGGWVETKDWAGVGSGGPPTSCAPKKTVKNAGLCHFWCRPSHTHTHTLTRHTRPSTPPLFLLRTLMPTAPRPSCPSPLM
jgi:hypothetical protein